jgi:phage tail-like protein
MAEAGRLLVQLAGRVTAIVPVNKPVLTIGREPSNDVTLPDSRVSRHHAELRVEPGGLALTDLGSLNGTWIAENTRLAAHRPHLLTRGTSFSIVPFVVSFQGVRPLHRHDEAFVGQEEGPAGPGEAVEEITPVAPTPPGPPLPRQTTPLAPGPRSHYLQDLPMIFQDNGFLGRFLLIFESIWEPLEQRQDHVAMYFDPNTCPAEFLPWLASWLGLSLHEHWPESRVREIVREATDLYRWRGTPYGMMRLIEVATGLSAEVSDDPQDPCVFRVGIQVPSDFQIDRELIETLIEQNKPAHTGYVLEVRS